MINEYLQMEQRIDALEKRLARFRGGKGRNDADDVNGDNDVTGGDDDEAAKDGSQAPTNQELSNKILAFQTEIRRLEMVTFRYFKADL